jgi:lipoprotein-anchoring transpeptidase ErfK/SrfK
VAGVCVWLWPRDRTQNPALSQDAAADASSSTDGPAPAPIEPPAQATPPSGEEPPGAEDQEPAGVDRGSRLDRELDALREAGDGDALRRRLGVVVLNDDLAPAVRARLLEEVDGLNRRLLFSATPLDGFITDTVRSGESYWTICRRLRSDQGIRVSPGLLQVINGVAPKSLRAGQSLKVPKEAVSLLVDKSDFTLYALLGGAYFKRYPIGIGRDGLTPEGTFTIGGKTAKPTWRDPKTGRSFKYGEAGHVIGSRWMGFLSEGRTTGYGIHGTIDPESIGQAESDGCIRLRNEHVEELFDLVPEGSDVVVRA